MTAIVLKERETKNTKEVPVRKKSSSSRAKMLSNVDLFCWHCQSVTKLSQSESGIPIPCDNCGEYMITPRGRWAQNVVVGDFVIKKRLGAGGAGTVYLAYQRSLDRECALKVLHDSVSGDNELLKEARIAAKLNHSNIVQCYAVSSEASLSYYAMEFVSGRTLKEVLDKNWKLVPVKALNITIQICEALTYAWNESRLVHRDIKPDNIMISEDGDVKVADFGLAMLTGEVCQTDSTVFKGTPEFVCPEMIRQETTDFRGDMYSLGVMLYQMLTGNLPFNSNDRVKLLQMHISDMPASLRAHAPDLPKELEYIVLRLLEKKPDKRYSSYDSLLKEFRRIRKDISSTNMGDTRLFLEKLHFGKDGGNNPDGSEQRSRRKPLLIAGSLLTLCAVGGAFAGREMFTKGNPVVEEPTSKPYSQLTITSVLPDPAGYDLGNEFFTLKNSSAGDISLDGLSVTDNSGQKMPLHGVVKAGGTLSVTLDEKLILLDNLGDELTLFDPDSELIQKVTFTRDMITQGEPVAF